MHKEKNKKNTKLFICPFKNCKKSYLLKNILLGHLRIHYGIKPFKCTYCNKTFNEKGNLKTHIRIHTGEKPFKCKECQKGFKALGQLKDHIISHTNFKPFQCPHCKKFYRRKEILKNHIVIHSKEDYFISNKDKFEEMQNEVMRMKYIKRNFDILNTDNKKKNSEDSSSSKEEAKQNILSTDNSYSGSNDEKEKIKEDNKFLENTIYFLGKTLFNFNSTNEEIIINNKLFKENFDKLRSYEINNLFPSRADDSIKDENYICKNKDFDIEKKIFIFQEQEKENELNVNNLSSKYLYKDFYDNYNDNKNKYENDEFSNITNLFYI